MMDGMRPLHPRAVQGIALTVIGVVAAVAGLVWYMRLDLRGTIWADDPLGSFVLMAAGGGVALAGVIIYAASPARVDWQPPEIRLGDRTRR